MAENGDPCSQHLPTRSGEGGKEAKVLIMDMGFSMEPDWAQSPEQVKPACQHNL